MGWAHGCYGSVIRLRVAIAYTRLIGCQGSDLNMRWSRSILQDDIGHNKSSC